MKPLTLSVTWASLRSSKSSRPTVRITFSTGRRSAVPQVRPIACCWAASRRIGARESSAGWSTAKAGLASAARITSVGRLEGGGGLVVLQVGRLDRAQAVDQRREVEVAGHVGLARGGEGLLGLREVRAGEQLALGGRGLEGGE